jgi:anaerobic magnesium-protoporphyrin IX monomethyl ester cyclase
MVILLANPPCRIEIDKERERYFVRSGSRWPFSIAKKKDASPDYVPFPFFMAYAAAWMEKEDHKVFVIDSIALNQSRDDFIEDVKRISPELILFETSTPTLNEDICLIRDIKKAISAQIVLAGAHVTAYPREVMAVSQVDFIIRGEYELTLRELARQINSGQTEDVYKDICGLVYRKGGEICINRDRELIAPLDQLPYPAFHLFPKNQKNDLACYWDGFCQYRPAVQLHSSRGCPFKCNFCLWNQVIYGNGKYRTFTAQRVVDEMELVIARYGAREIYFDDDSLTIDKGHVIGICGEIKKRGLKIKWSCMADAICLDREMIREMAESGCIGIKFGVENGEEEILRRIGKPLNFDKLKDLVKSCVKRKIKTHATFTFGLSGENRRSMEKTLEFAKSLDVDTVQFSVTTPFPGTRFYQELKERGMLKAESWSEYDGAGRSVVKYNELTSEEVENFCKHASPRWLRHKLLDARWVVRQLFNLNRVRKGQGYKGLFKKVSRFVDLTIS